MGGSAWRSCSRYHEDDVGIFAVLHKLRRAMVRLDRELLKAHVEVEETHLGGLDGKVTGPPSPPGRSERPGKTRGAPLLRLAATCG